MGTVKAISKQLLGAQYERITKSLLACLILFFALFAAEIRIPVAPFILFLTATVFTAGVMWQTLSSSQNAESMMGLFMLPFENKELTFSYTVAFSGYTLITKSSWVLALFFAVGNWSILQVLVALLCACNGCMMATVWYSMMGQKRILPAFLWETGIILSIFYVQQLPVLFCIVFISLGLSVLYLRSVNAYTFYRPVSAKALVKHSGKTGSVFIYLLRYLITNKNYLINTFGLWGIACFLPLLLGQFEGLNIMPLGFAILCLNTPICILLSCDPGTEQAIRVLPGQAIRFGSRYCLFIFLVHMTTSTVYLFSWQFQYGGISGMDVLMAVLFALQSAVLSVLLEWLRPIRHWKVENDLWHHPRKYVVPLLMMLVAAFISTWPFMVWIWLCVLLIEILSFLLIARRI
ncbi:hypothetical protein ACFQ3W_16495 [Paenibacillus puldeungensis]|uniref:Sporulation killing factor system integral membrane protein n=1 Tax=Paenibacillus puldeungensis TaxID=696536 RepID=A0ABW3RZF5_9BACL